MMAIICIMYYVLYIYIYIYIYIIWSSIRISKIGQRRNMGNSAVSTVLLFHDFIQSIISCYHEHDKPI